MNEITPHLDLNDLSDAVAAAACPTVFFAVTTWLLGIMVFRPLYARGLYTPPNTRFRIADIIILLVQLQVAGTLAVLGYRLWLGGPVQGQYVSGLVLCSLVTLWWFTGVRMLAKARVEFGPHRVIFLALTLPAGYLATIGVVFAPVTLMVMLASIISVVTGPRDAWAEMSFMLLIVINMTVACVLVVCYRHCQTIIQRAHDDAARREGIEFQPAPQPNQGDLAFAPSTKLELADDTEVHIVEDD